MSLDQVVDRAALEVALLALELPASATPAEVRFAWRQLAMTHHPDRGGDPHIFAALNHHYKVATRELSKPRECDACQGRGHRFVSNGFSSLKVACAACGGGGQIEATRDNRED